jgi:glycosyltransferase involved in cell wall biosynthesis
VSDALPTLSVVLPTLNAERHLEACLTALVEQDYPRDRIEILLIDAGSSDHTLEIASRIGVDRLLGNPLKTGEAGKAVGIRAARGELVVSVDSDNVVVGRDWLRRMVAPFDDPEIIAAEVMRWDYWRGDSLINRWHALSGVADPLTLYTGNYARDSLVTGRWTDLPTRSQRARGWDRVELDPRHVPVLGANGFAIRRSAFEDFPVGDYYFDVDFVHDLVQADHRTIARVDVAIRHHFCDDMRGYVRKTRRRADDFFYFSGQYQRSYPWTRRARVGTVDFVLSTVLVLPVLRDALRGMRRRPDAAWLFHPVACWVTLVVYAVATVRGQIAPRILDRAGWKQ